MATPAPTLLVKGKGEAIPVNGAGVFKEDAPKATKAKTPVEGEKVIIRRLPPGMTEDEFKTIIGEEWMPGYGRCDWFSFSPGKVARE
jgi:regulator of nonsense transcripts 3